jgi:hypothetical protein
MTINTTNIVNIFLAFPMTLKIFTSFMGTPFHTGISGIIIFGGMARRRASKSSAL